MRTLLCTSIFSMPAMAAVVFLTCTQACVELSDALRGFGACGSQSYQHATNEATAELYIAMMSFSERALGTGK
jgi:hypothetical protein